MSATDNPNSKQLYEFGPFRVDPEKEILQRDGNAIPLQPKTFQILLVLIRHNQELVTKDDLMKAVWPDTFVEEANLSRNVFMLRKALGENPPEQRYVITVPGRGYRLAENVRLVPEQQLSIVAAKHEKVEIQIAQARPWPWIALAAIVVLALVGASLHYFRSRTVLTEKDTVVLADFTNSTGDPVFDGTLRQGMTVQLEQSPFLNLISYQRIRHTLRFMGLSPDAALTGDVARQVCERTGSAAVLEGSIAKLGSEYVLGLRANNCHTGDLLDEEQARVTKKEDVLSALSEIATRFRTRVGESLSTIRQHNTPLAEATTPSLEALEAYSTAWKVQFANGAIASQPLFQRAAEIDPKFAMAHAALGRMYADLDQYDRSVESITRAWQLRSGTSDREQFFITGGYETLVTGNLEQARQTFEAWARTYPREPIPRSFLAGQCNKVAGRYEMAAAEGRKTIELDPDFSFGYYGLAVNQAYLGRLEDAENTLAQATRRGLDVDEFIMLDHDLAFLRGDSAGMERAAVRARQRSEGENWISAHEASAFAYSGRLREARTAARRAVDHAHQAGQPKRAAFWEAGAAIREAFFGFAPEARNRAAAALGLSRERDTEYGAALALALAGDFRRAGQLADDLEKRFPEDTSVRFSYLPVLRARLALSKGEAAAAIEALDVAVPNELGVPRSAISGLYGALYPIYVRGEAYLVAGKGAEAVAEFQKILDHRVVVISDPIGALAHLQLGRAHALSHDKSKARSCYQDFFTLWKDADSDIPVLKQAKSEYAKLE